MAATSSGRWSGAARLAPHLLAGAFVLGCLAALAHRLAAGPALAGTAAAGALAAHAIARRRAGAALGLVAVALGLGAWGWSSVRAEPPGDGVPSGGARGTIVVDTPPRPARGRV